jgi:hypothetical protein
MTKPPDNFASDPARSQPHCSCGALLTGRSRRCRKCRARVRYNWRRRHEPTSPRNGRPGTGPGSRGADQ